METTKDFIIGYLKNYYLIHKESPILYQFHPFTRYNIKKYFKTWNNALKEAGIPCNQNETILTECKICNKEFYKQFKEIKRSNNDFCSHSCAAKFNNKGRPVTQETRDKIRKKLEIPRYTNCKICNKEFRYYKRKNLTCSSNCLSNLKKINNKKRKGIIIESYDINKELINN